MISTSDTGVVEWGSPASRATRAVIAVHGRGLDPADMRERSTRFAVDSVRFYAPSATGRSWYPGSFLEPIERNQAGVEEGLLRVSAAIGRARQDGFALTAIAVWGFSQGACLLAQHLLTTASDGHPAAALLFTGGFIGTTPPTVARRSLEGMPVLLRSIQQDPFVPAERVRATAGLLASAGADVDVRIDPGDQHIVLDEAYTRGSAIIGALTGGTT